MAHYDTIGRMYRILVVGRGIIGLSIADELARRGHEVTIASKFRGGIASQVAAGILPAPPELDATDPLDNLRRASHLRFPDWIEKLEKDTHGVAEFRRCGGIYLSRGRGEAASLRATVRQMRDEKIDFEELSDEQVVEIEPVLSHLVDHSDLTCFRVPNEWTVKPRSLVGLIETSCRKQRVQFLDVESLAFEPSPSMVKCIINVGGVRQEIAYDFICIAAGTWSNELLNPLGVDLPLEPRKGQMLVWKANDRHFGHVLNEGLLYSVCRDDGTILVGATVEDVGFDIEETSNELQKLRSFAFSLLPHLSELPEVDSWIGLRPCSLDGRPFLGEAIERTYVASGHFRSGIHLAPITAEVISDLIDGKDSDLDLSVFRVGR